MVFRLMKRTAMRRMAGWMSAATVVSISLVAAQPHPCAFTVEPVTVDGVLDEAVWREAPPLAFWAPVTQATPRSRAWARMAWSSDELFVAFSASDEHLWATRTVRDTDTFRDDCFEVFVMPREPRFGYHAFETNLLGVTHDGLAGAGGARWDGEGVRFAPRTEGTANVSEDLDTGWAMEVAIPFLSLDALGSQRPRPGDMWRFNLARRDVDPRWPGGFDLSCTAPVSVGNFHHWVDWGQMVFTAP